MKWFPKDDFFMMIFTNSTMDGKLGFEVIEGPLENVLFGDEIAFPPVIKPIDLNEFPDISCS